MTIISTCSDPSKYKRGSSPFCRLKLLAAAGGANQMCPASPPVARFATSIAGGAWMFFRAVETYLKTNAICVLSKIRFSRLNVSVIGFSNLDSVWNLSIAIWDFSATSVEENCFYVLG